MDINKLGLMTDHELETVSVASVEIENVEEVSSASGAAAGAPVGAAAGAASAAV